MGSRRLSGTLQKLLLPIFQRFNVGDITIRHPWTQDRLRLHSFIHKGYWFHGRSRNRGILELLGALIGTGDCVLDLGGHIGYTAIYFSSLVGASGHVYVFEPDPDSLAYLRPNIASCARTNITVVESAASDSSGFCTLFLDSVTGQNSTIVPEFKIRHLAGKLSTFSVRTTTIDEFVKENGIRPTFLTVDTEGAEAQVLTGMRETLANARPRLLVEISLNASKVLSLLRAADYEAYFDSGRPIRSADQLINAQFVFAFHRVDSIARARFTEAITASQTIQNGLLL